MTTATSSSEKVSASIANRTSFVAGVNSDGLIMARLPAARVVASGIKASENG